VAGRNNSDRILELERQAATLLERVERLRTDLERAEESRRDSGVVVWREQIAQVSGKIDLVAQDLGRTKDDLKEMRVIRWEIWKMILTPLISAVLSAIVSGVVASLVVQRRRHPKWSRSRSPRRRDHEVGLGRLLGLGLSLGRSVQRSREYAAL